MSGYSKFLAVFPRLSTLTWPFYSFQELVHTFIAAKEEFEATRPFEDDVHLGVMKFVGAMENWVSGNEEWSFESDRYFGARHLEIKNSREVMVQWKVKIVPQ